MRGWDAQILKPILKALNQKASLWCWARLTSTVRNQSKKDRWALGIWISNWIIPNPGMWVLFEENMGYIVSVMFVLTATNSLMFCVSSPELTPAFVFTSCPSPSFNPWLSLFHSYICLLLTVLLGRIYHHLLTYLSQNLSFDQLVFYNLHLFYI